MVVIEISFKGLIIATIVIHPKMFFKILSIIRDFLIFIITLQRFDCLLDFIKLKIIVTITFSFKNYLY